MISVSLYENKTGKNIYSNFLRNNVDPKIEVLETEKISRLNARRSIVSSKFIPKGKIIKMEDLSFKRPGSGITPDKVGNLIGKKAKIDILEDTILDFGFFGN